MKSRGRSGLWTRFSPIAVGQGPQRGLGRRGGGYPSRQRGGPQCLSPSEPPRLGDGALKIWRWEWDPGARLGANEEELSCWLPQRE